MRKVYSIFALLLAMMLLVGCAREQEPVDRPYEIVVEDGAYYIVLGEELSGMVEASRNYCGLRVTPAVRFGSVSEMKRKIEACDLTASELYELVAFPADDSGRIPIMDLSKLYQSVYPSAFDEVSVSWKGAEYDFSLRSSGDGLSCYFDKTSSKEIWEKAVNSWCGLKEQEHIEVIDQATENERNAQIISYKTSSGLYQKAYYTIQNGDDILHVFESYDVVEDVPKLKEIELYGLTNGYYFDAYIRANDYGTYFERPTVEWLSKFEMKDYTEAPSWVLPTGVCCVVLFVGAGIAVLICRKKKKASASTKEEDIE